jgi:site-specific DNA-cytosine methylase
MNVLVINTYGGSLLLGAKAAKANVVAVMEDTGFGSDLQALNFPKIPRYEKRADWPEKFSTVWRDIDVVAHPPCSAFSVMNFQNAASTRGMGTSAFACHQAVIDYALGHKARTLVIESVTPAYEIAHEVYEENAHKYGYRVNYIMINSASCGVPQWRERVWVVYHKCKTFKIAIKPEYAPLKSILNTKGTTENLFGVDGQRKRAWDKIRSLIKPSWPSGSIHSVLEKVYDLPRVPRLEAVTKRFGLSKYIDDSPKLIDRDGFSSVVLSGTVLCDGPRPLTVEEYCAIMGFPRNYKWGKQIKKFRMYLSKGVCPPVATWIMQMVDKNASGWTGKHTHEEADFGGVIDIRPKKAEALALANGEPWPPVGKIVEPRALRRTEGAVIKARRDPSLPRGHRYRLVDASKCVAPNSPQAAFILTHLKHAGARGFTRNELVGLAVKDPKGFPTNQPHDRAIGFFLSKFKSLGGLEFAE